MNNQDQPKPENPLINLPPVNAMQQTSTEAQPKTRRRARRKARIPRAKRVAIEAPAPADPTPEQAKAELEYALRNVSGSTLRKILIGCGIAAGVAIGIIAFTKFVPVGVAILAILGLGVVVRFLEELRHLPFCFLPRP